MCEATKPDIVCIVETGLDNTIADNELSLPNFQLFSRDHNRHGGGIALYVSDNLVCNILCIGANDLEFSSVSVASSLFSKKLCLCIFYRPPSSPVSIFDDLCNALFMLKPHHYNFVLLGDFNVNFLNKKHHLFSYVSDLMCNFSLSQVVTSFTHLSPSGNNSLIDLAFLSQPELLLDCSTIHPLSSSDHLGISLLSGNSPLANPTKSRKVWLYQQAVH